MNTSSFSIADLDPAILSELHLFEEHFGKLCGRDIVLVAYQKNKKDEIE